MSGKDASRKTSLVWDEFSVLKPGLSCFVKVKGLLIRGAARGRPEDLRDAHGRGRSDKELKR